VRATGITASGQDAVVDGGIPIGANTDAVAAGGRLNVASGVRTLRVRRSA
jgi:hypothetical protein